MSVRRPLVLAAAGAAVVALAVALWARGDAPETPDVAAATDALTGAPGAGDAAAPAAAPEGDPLADGPDGTWVVTVDAVASDPAAGRGAFVGFRIDEELSTLGAITAVGRTPEVSGELTVADGALVDGTFRAPLAGLTTDDARRDGAVRRLLGDLEATFVVDGPVTLAELPAPGRDVALQVPGTLTVGGASVAVVADLRVAVEGATLVVVGTVPTRLSALGIDAPRAPIVLSVADDVLVEVQLYLVRRA